MEFAYEDLDALRAVRVRPDLGRRSQPIELTPASHRRPRTWRGRLPRPELDRLEYVFELVHRNGSTHLVLDPANPLRARGPFGEKSEVRWPEYREPAWLAADPPPGDLVELEVRSRALRAHVPVLVWARADAEPGEPLPLLVVHDGPETAEYTQLLRLLAAADVPPLRAALIAPVARNEIYSACALYARALAHELLPAVLASAPTPDEQRMRIGLGASLGALALLHAHRQHPRLFGALFLQSGSFFRRASDPHEGDFPRFDRISRFVGSVLRGDGASPIPITMTCGRAEENLGNNRAVAAALAGQGYDVRLHEVRDAHTWTGWRDAFDPHLLDLLRRCWDPT